MRGALLATVCVVAVAVPSLACAGEPVRLVLDAPADCLSEEELVADVALLGTAPVLADEGERARRFVVTMVAERGAFRTRLVVRDLVGRETTRAVSSASCADAKRSAALLVSIALDDEEESVPVHETPAPFPWPEPVAPAERAERQVPLSRIGSGGMMLSGLYGLNGGVPDLETYGVRGIAVTRVGRSRLGGTFSFQREQRIDWDRFEEPRLSSTFGRGGFVTAVGAPWNDGVVGFVLEGGVEGGRSARRAFHGSSNGNASNETRHYVSPYVATSLLLQVPWKAPVRPIAGFIAACAPAAADRKVSLAGEVGVVWQAW